jgi:hypothetical protein
MWIASGIGGVSRRIVGRSVNISDAGITHHQFPTARIPVRKWLANDRPQHLRAGHRPTAQCYQRHSQNQSEPPHLEPPESLWPDILERFPLRWNRLLLPSTEVPAREWNDRSGWRGLGSCPSIGPPRTRLSPRMEKNGLAQILGNAPAQILYVARSSSFRPTLMSLNLRVLQRLEPT